MTAALSWVALAIFAAWEIVAHLRAWQETSRLRTILAGREKPPSVEEMRAHAAGHPWAGDRTTGRWLVRAPDAPNGAEASAVMMLRALPDGRCFASTINDDWYELPDNPGGTHAPGSRWWPLAVDGAPCAWPVMP
ncbi:MAG: hypothetical protein EPO40_16625 [Myxococcaceae bacterium]|nr:MAG: hypothetical protein EPO40_16625 [Myxococcaceae bacterium]